MSTHNERQKSYYAQQYSSYYHFRSSPKDNLREWSVWYRLLLLGEFFSTLSGQSLLVTCAGTGRELALLSKYGIKITATDLIIEQLEQACLNVIINTCEVQNATRLTYKNESFDYGFVNAGLHHLQYPHAGLVELLRCARKGVIMIEAQDTFLHAIARHLGRRADWEKSGNYVYRWKKREIEKFCLSANLHSWAVKTVFLPTYMKMKHIRGSKMKACKRLILLSNKMLSSIGNCLIALFFKQSPTPDQLTYLSSNSFKFKMTSKFVSKYSRYKDKLR